MSNMSSQCMPIAKAIGTLSLSRVFYVGKVADVKHI